MSRFLISLLIAGIVSLILFGAFLFTGLGILIFLIIMVAVLFVLFILTIIKKAIKIILIVSLLILIFFYYNNTFSEEGKIKCKVNNNCVHGGRDILTNNPCFVGNKNYYSLFVDKKVFKICQEFKPTTKVKCISNRCELVEQNLTEK